MCLLVANLCLLLYQQWRQKHAPASMRNQSLAAPAVSSQYGFVSNELSAEGLLRHSLNSCGLAPVLRAATLLQTPVSGARLRSPYVFGSYTQDVFRPLTNTLAERQARHGILLSQGNPRIPVVGRSVGVFGSRNRTDGRAGRRPRGHTRR